MKDNEEIYTLALIRVIHDSREYREYEAVKRKVALDEPLKKKINKYRMECYKLQNEGAVEDLYERTEQFYVQYKDFLNDPLVEEYLKCELAICRMLQKIARNVVASLDLQLEDIAGEIHS